MYTVLNVCPFLFSSSVCLDDYIIQSTNHTSVERVGSVSMFVNWDEMLTVILHFNMSSHDRWTTYTSFYDLDKLGNIMLFLIAEQQLGLDQYFTI